MASALGPLLGDSAATREQCAGFDEVRRQLTGGFAGRAAAALVRLVAETGGGELARG